MVVTIHNNYGGHAYGGHKIQRHVTFPRLTSVAAEVRNELKPRKRRNLYHHPRMFETVPVQMNNSRATPHGDGESRVATSQLCAYTQLCTVAISACLAIYTVSDA